jgi:hypothetical protein
MRLLPAADRADLLASKPTRAFMNNQEPDLNPTPAETDSAKTNESVQREGSELPVDQRSSYLRSRQIALKKFSPQGFWCKLEKTGAQPLRPG